MLVQDDLFPASEKHSAGGLVQTRLPAGLQGDAVFKGDRDQYRPLLRRWMGPEFPNRCICFIGMNPSTASADFNDPTITREWGFAAREGFTGYIKCNVSDYRATHPNDLLESGLELQGPTNHQVVGIAADATMTVVCWGKVNRALAPHAERLLRDLRFAGVELWCFGKNADGSPKHPLYLRADTPLVRYS